MHAQSLEREQLFQLIANLAGLLDKDIVVETVGVVLGVDPVEKDDCVVFGDLTIKFGLDGRVMGVSQLLDGTSEPAKTIIQNLTNGDTAT